jgi:lipopolysaccharide biosynthesis protein
MTAAIVETASAKRHTSSDMLLASLGCMAGFWTTIATRASRIKAIPSHVWLASYLMMVAVVFVAAYTAIRLHNLMPGPISVRALKAPTYPPQLLPYIDLPAATEPETEAGER